MGNFAKYINLNIIIYMKMDVGQTFTADELRDYFNKKILLNNNMGQTFKCPVCGKVVPVKEAKHKKDEDMLQRQLLNIKDKWDYSGHYIETTYKAKYYNYRLCKECYDKNRKGMIAMLVATIVMYILLYVFLGYYYFNVEDSIGNDVLGPLGSRDTFGFIITAISVTVVAFYFILMIALYFVWKVLGLFPILKINNYEAAMGNAIAPFDEENQ